MTNNITFEELHPKVVLAVAAHADDIDFCMSGAIAKWARAGAEIHYLILTNGNRGTADTGMDQKRLAQIRQDEQRAAARLLGVKDVTFGSYDDGCLCCDDKVRRDIVRAIRQHKPDVVMTMDPTMVYDARWGYINHPDHRAAGQATLDAVYPLARDHLSFPKLIKKEHLQPHKVGTLLLVNFEHCNYPVDITGYMERKQEAMAAHVSQVSDANAVRKMIHDQAAEFGKRAGYDYAESYVRIDVHV